MSDPTMMIQRVQHVMPVGSFDDGAHRADVHGQIHTGQVGLGHHDHAAQVVGQAAGALVDAEPVELAQLDERPATGDEARRLDAEVLDQFGEGHAAAVIREAHEETGVPESALSS